MNILVCFKVVPEWDGVLDDDWTVFCGGESLDYVKRVFNCFDESALEIALRLKETGGHCTALTVGAPPPSFLWKQLYAAGFDRVVHIGGEAAAERGFGWEFQPWRVADEIAGFVRANDFDLILTGKQAGAADTGCVPFMLAEKLGLPAVSGAENLTTGDGVLSVTRETGHENLTAALPLVAVIGNSPVAALRAVTLRARLAAGERELEFISANVFPVSPVLFREERTVSCEFWEGGAAESAKRALAVILEKGAVNAC